jgi:fatty acid/phospholipid biosynthesis enzyme
MRIRVALDLAGCAAAPGAVLDAAALVAAGQPGVALTLVGPPHLAGDRFPVVPASGIACLSGDPGRDVAEGGRADVVVADGFTGGALCEALAPSRPRLVLGVRGVSVVAHEPSPAALAAAVEAAARAVAAGLPARCEEALAPLVAGRRAAVP